MKITEDEYLEALKIVREYLKQINREVEKTHIAYEPELGILNLNWSTRTRNVILDSLRYHEIDPRNYSLNQFCNDFAQIDFMKSKGAGAATVAEVCDMANKHGLRFRIRF